VLISVLRERYPDLDGHLARVTELAGKLGVAMGLRSEQLEELQLASELHDIGKVAVPDTILMKRGPLDAAEREYVERHSEIGARIVAAARAHHRVDAIASERPYAHVRGVGAALRELRRNSGSQFDPLVVAALCDVVADDATSSLLDGATSSLLDEGVAPTSVREFALGI
jgi:HD-GYP domain-containing protein (c-di-GMP phosphodiesterase class II)